MGIVADLAAGKDPQPTKQNRQQTFAKAAESYLADYAKTHAATSIRSETWGVKYASRELGKRTLDAIGTAEAQRIRTAYAESPANARRAWGAARRVLDHAIANGWAGTNPFAGLRAPRAPEPRASYPRLDELAVIWRACEETQGTGADIIRFLIALPLRAATAASLTWGEVDLSAKELRLRPSDGRKYRGEHVLPLPGLAVEVLRGLKPEDPDLESLVFATKARNPEEAPRPFNGWSKAVSRIRKRSGVGGWSPHDLRRAMVSIVADHRPEISEASLDRLLTHAASSTNSGVKAVYQRSAGMAGMRLAADAWDQILRGALAGSVVPMRRAS
jgi:integrase